MPGLWFEEFKVGMVFDHRWTRTITEADNKWFSLLTMNTQPLHIDNHAAARSVWKKPLVNSLFTLGCMIGMSVDDTTFGTTIANLGMSDTRFPHPLFEGDTIRVRTTIIAVRESKSRPGEGIVTFRHECFNQDGVLCGICERAGLMMSKPKEKAAAKPPKAAPKSAKPAPKTAKVAAKAKAAPAKAAPVKVAPVKAAPARRKKA